MGKSHPDLTSQAQGCERNLPGTIVGSTVDEMISKFQFSEFTIMNYQVSLPS